MSDSVYSLKLIVTANWKAVLAVAVLPSIKHIVVMICLFILPVIAGRFRPHSIPELLVCLVSSLRHEVLLLDLKFVMEGSLAIIQKLLNDPSVPISSTKRRDQLAHSLFPLRLSLDAQLR